MIGLLLIPGPGLGPERIFEGPEAVPGIGSLPERGLMALTPVPGSARARLLARIAATLPDLRVTAGAREALSVRSGFGFAYRGTGAPGAEQLPEDFWSLCPGWIAIQSKPVKRPIEMALSLAVLPFQAVGGGPELGQRAMGLSDAITFALVRFRDISVMARATSRVWADSRVPPYEIARRMGVGYVLSGTMSLRQDLALLDLALTESRTGRAIWAERFLRPVPEFSLMAEEICGRVVAATVSRIRAEETPGDAPGGAPEPPRDETPRDATPRDEAARDAPPRAPSGQADRRAADLLLRAQAMLARDTSEGVAEAGALIDAALALAPCLAGAHALRARCATLTWRQGWAREGLALLDAARAEAARALALDPLDARAHQEAGFASLYAKDYRAALDHYGRALELNPRDPDLLADAGDALSHCGRAAEALPLFDRAMRYNPWFPDVYLWQLSGAFFNLRRYEDALATVGRMQNPSEGRRIQAAALAWLGRHDEARAAVDEILALRPGFTVADVERAIPNSDPEDTRHLAEGLRRAGLP